MNSRHGTAWVRPPRWRRRIGPRQIGDSSRRYALAGAAARQATTARPLGWAEPFVLDAMAWEQIVRRSSS